MKLCNILVIFIILKVVHINSQDCDTRKIKFKEGNLGKSGDFPWLGILRVIANEQMNKKSLRTYLTGIVLIKHNYAIGNANDLAKVSTNQLRHDAKAMFLVEENTVWSSNVADCILHPEHDYSTTSTVAIIILDDSIYDNKGVHPPTPVCLFQKQFYYNSNTELYLVKYTDERKLLDKVVHRMDFIPNDLCLEYYKRTQFPNKDTWPVQPVCAYATKMKNTCLWDNAMALVYNSNGTVILVGIGVFGPGCGVPSRYIEIYPYVPWIQSVVKMQEEIY